MNAASECVAELEIQMAAVAVLPQEALAGPAEESRSHLQLPPVGKRDTVAGLEHEVAVAQAQRAFYFEAL